MTTPDRLGERWTIDAVGCGEGNAAFCEDDPYKTGAEDASFDKLKKSLIRLIRFLLARLRDYILKIYWTTTLFAFVGFLLK